MTSTLDAPPRADHVATPADAPPARDLWRRALLRAMLAPLPVLAPLVALAPTRDHRFNVYWHGALYRDDPLSMIPETVRQGAEYVRLGNFRPLGRILEKSFDLAAYTLGDVGVPINVSLRVMSFVAAVLLCVVAVLLVESVVGADRMFRRAPSTLAALVPFAVAAGFVAAGGSSPAVLFGGLYYTSAALVMAVPALLCRIRPDRRLRAWHVALLLLGGATLACVNEVLYLALPLAVVAVAARLRLVLKLTWRQALTAAPARAVALLWAGFLPVFVTVRVIIYRYCSDGSCYKGSDVHLGPDVLTTLPVRAVGWLPPLLWRSASTAGGRFSSLVLLAAFAMLALLAWHARRDLSRLTRPDRRATTAVVAVAGTLVLLGAAMGSLAVDVQTMVGRGHWGAGWRDTAVTTTAGAVLLVAAVHLVATRRLALSGVILLLVVTATVSAGVNKRYRDAATRAEAGKLANRIAAEMADFDRTPAGAARRCALRAEFFAQNPDLEFSRKRFDESLTVAAEQRAGMPFCPTIGG